MIASGVLCLALGLPLVVLGFYFKNAPQDGGKKGKKKKAKGSGGELRKPPARVGSLVWGGAAFSLLGAGLLVAALMRG